MERWDLEARPVRQGYPPAVVQRHCVQSSNWQCFRISLKGVATREKLTRLSLWYDGMYATSNRHTRWEREVQVGNYLGALRRGGQLDADNKVKRHL